jgi:Protein of unknown function (DUF3037)
VTGASGPQASAGTGAGVRAAAADGAEGYVPFEYAVLRAVPRVDRGEFINVGVVLYCQARDYLATVHHIDEARLLALDPRVDLDAVGDALAGVEAVCAGRAVGGGAAGGSRRERFGWLTAPRSTVVQTGPVHSGLTRDPDGDLRRLLDRLVR